MSSFSICGCCRRKSEEAESHLEIVGALQGRPVDVEEHISLSVLSEETPGQTARQLRDELAGVRQRKEDEKKSQQKTAAATSRLHQSRMDDMKSGHDADMAQMRQSNRDDSKACNATMTTMEANAQRQMDRHMADHNANIKALRRANDGMKVKSNERINVLKLANAQRRTNMEQRLDAQCSDLKQRQRAGEMAHSQRMKVLSFSHAGMASNARIRNADDLEAWRKDTKAKRQAQQSKVDAANERHHRNVDGEALRHGQEMREMKTSSDAKTAEHCAKVDRMNDKNKHKGEDANHMALHFVSLENKLKQSEARCAGHERTLAKNAQTIREAKSRWDLLIAQSEVIVAVKGTIAKNSTEAERQTAAVKKGKFNNDAEEKCFLRDGIEQVLNVNIGFGEEMTTFIGMLRDLNVQMRTEHCD